jgi:hypothetical protein
MKDELFNINYKRLVLMVAAHFQEKTGNPSFLWCLIFPLEALYIEFLKKKKTEFN